MKALSMKALVISPQPFFSSRGTPLSVYYRALVMAQRGVEIDLLTYGEGADVDIDGVRIIRIPRFAFLGRVKTGPSLLKLFLDAVLVLWTVALLARRRYDFVHAHEEAVFFCRFLKPIFRFRLLYDMHSSLPQQLVNFEFTTWRPVLAAFRWLEMTSLAHSDVVLTISPGLARYAAERVSAETLHVLLENSIYEDVRLVSPNPAESYEPWEESLPRGRAIVAYAGAFDHFQNLDTLISAFADVRAQRPDAFLLLVGGTREQVAKQRRHADAAGLNGHCLFTGRVEPAMVTRLMKHATVATSPRTGETFTPLKIYRHLAEGPPLVATRIPAHTEVLDDEVCFLADADRADLAGVLLEALNDSSARHKVAASARARYERHYSRAAYERKVDQVLEALRSGRFTSAKPLS